MKRFSILSFFASITPEVEQDTPVLAVHCRSTVHAGHLAVGREFVFFSRLQVIGELLALGIVFIRVKRAVRGQPILARAVRNDCWCLTRNGSGFTLAARIRGLEVLWRTFVVF
jgi:hypothetical protein